MKLNPWPCAIIGYFVVFILGVATWVTFAIRNQDQLVRSDYYEHEIKYQKQIERETRTAAILADVDLTYQPTDQTIKIDLSKGSEGKVSNPQLHLYRPSDSKLDRILPLNPSITGAQFLSVADCQTGFWRARVSWSFNGLEYYFEKPLMLATGKN